MARYMLEPRSRNWVGRTNRVREQRLQASPRRNDFLCGLIEFYRVFSENHLDESGLCSALNVTHPPRIAFGADKFDGHFKWAVTHPLAGVLTTYVTHASRHPALPSRVSSQCPASPGGEKVLLCYIGAITKDATFLSHCYNLGHDQRAEADHQKWRG